MKIFDCITFYQENFITNIRFEILNDCIDYFIICESKFNHIGEKKNLNFRLLNEKFKKKLIYLILESPFPKSNNPWKNQAIQREYILKNLDLANSDDYILFSDPDEIPNPETLKNLYLNKKYGIFLQKSYCYKFNLYNKFETPWEGTRVCKKKDLKSIDYMRQKIKSKNLKAPFWKFYKNKNLEIINDGGWHFNSLLTPKEISSKLRSFAHQEFSSPEYSNEEIIKENISNHRDLFKRNFNYEKVELDKTFPKFILENKDLFKEWIV